MCSLESCPVTSSTDKPASCHNASPVSLTDSITELCDASSASHRNRTNQPRPEKEPVGNSVAAFVLYIIVAIEDEDDLHHRVEIDVCYSVRENQPSKLLPIGIFAA